MTDLPRRRARLAAWMLLLTAAFCTASLAVPGNAQAAEATITVKPAAVPAEGRTTVTVTGFDCSPPSPSAELALQYTGNVQIWLQEWWVDKGALWTLVQAAESRSAGSTDIIVTIPAGTTPGLYRLMATCQVADMQQPLEQPYPKATARVSVTVKAEPPSISARPRSAVPGKDFEISGHKLKCPEVSQVTISATSPATPEHKLIDSDVQASVDGEGGLSHLLKVRADAQPGQYTVTARCTDDDTVTASTSVYVPGVTLVPGSGKTTDPIHAAGSGFDCNGDGPEGDGQAEILWDEDVPGFPVTSPVSGTGWSFGTDFKIPERAGEGRHVVTARCKDYPEVSVTTEFVVEGTEKGHFEEFGITPDHGNPGQFFQASGRAVGCADVRLTWDTTTELGKATPDSTDDFSASFKVPKVNEGQHEVTGHCGEDKISLTFTVTKVLKPELFLDPPVAYPGDVITPIGTGFDCRVGENAAGSVEVLWPGSPEPKSVNSQTVTPEGSFAGSFTIPDDAKHGPYKVTARCIGNEKVAAERTLTVLQIPFDGPPGIKATPGSGATGQAVQLSGIAFDCDAAGRGRSGQALVTWDGGTPLPTADVSDQGAFISTFSVPEGAREGVHTISAECATNPGSAATALFVVIADPGLGPTKPPITPTVTPTSPGPRSTSPSPSTSTSSPPGGPSVPTTGPTGGEPTGPTPTSTDPTPSPSPTTTTSPPPPPQVTSVSVSPKSALPGATVLVMGRKYPQDCESYVPRLADRVLPLRSPITAVDRASNESAVTGAVVVPAGTRPGRRVLDLDCVSGGQRRVSAAADLQIAGPPGNDDLRSGLASLLPSPHEVPFGLPRSLASVLLAGLIIVAVGFPAEVFNKTYEKNRDDIRGLLRLGNRDWTGGSTAVRVALFITVSAGLLLVAGGGVGPNFKTLFSAIGIIVAVVATTALYSGVAVAYRYHVTGERVQLRPVPSALVVAAMCSVATVAAGFRPGYVYGLFLAADEPERAGRTTGGRGRRRRRPASQRENEVLAGRGVLIAAAVTLGAVVVAWVARIPLDSAADDGSRDAWVLLGDAVLAGFVVMGIETVLFALIPLTFMDGRDLAEWSDRAWAGVMGFTTLFFTHVLFATKAGETRTPGAGMRMLALFLAFGLASLAFWGFFELRGRRARRTPAGSGVSGSAGGDGGGDG